MDYRYILIIVSVLTSISSSFGSQAITTSSGKTATLQCPIANLVSDLQSLYWRKDGTTIYSLTGSGVHTIGKYLVTLTASLVIPDVTESDAGNYSCKVVRQSLATEESDVMQLYVIDVSVSHCKGASQEVDGCSCSINGSNITSLECSASGFPHPPVITWEEDSIIYQSSSVDLTRFNENITLTCKARDENVESAVENKTVCVYYALEVTSSGGSRVETTTASVNNRGAAIVLYIFLILVLLSLLILSVAAVYLHKTGRVFRLPYKLKRTPMSKPTSEGGLRTSQLESTPVNVELENSDSSQTDGNRDLSKATSVGDLSTPVNDYSQTDCIRVLSKATSVGDLSTSQPESTPVNVELENSDSSQTDGNRDLPEKLEESYNQPVDEMNIFVNDSEIPDMKKESWKSSKGSGVGDLPTSQLIPLVGQVLLGDLRSASEETKKSIKAVVIALVEKRAKAYKIYQSPGDRNASFMNSTMQRSMKTVDDPDAAFVDMVLEELDKILDEIDRDECEILITKPDFHEVTDESQIPAYQGKTVINQSLIMQSNMTSSMTSSMVAGNPFSTVLREELVKKPSERAAIRIAISQIILDFLKAGHSGLKVNNKYNLNCSTVMLPCTNASSYEHEVVDDEVSRLVAFWTSKTVKLDNDVNSQIRKYLFPLKPRNVNKSSDSHPVVKTRQEEDEIPDIPSTAKLLGDKMPR